MSGYCAVHNPDRMTLVDYRAIEDQIRQLWQARVGYLFPRNFCFLLGWIQRFGETRMRELVVSVANAIRKGRIGTLEGIGEYVGLVIKNYSQGIFYGAPVSYRHLMYL